MNASIHIPTGHGPAGAELYLCVSQSHVFAALAINRKSSSLTLASSATYTSDSRDGRLRARVIDNVLVVGAHYTLSPAAVTKAVDWLCAQGVDVVAARQQTVVSA